MRVVPTKGTLRGILRRTGQEAALEAVAGGSQRQLCVAGKSPAKRPIPSSSGTETSSKGGPEGGSLGSVRVPCALGVTCPGQGAEKSPGEDPKEECRKRPQGGHHPHTPRSGQVQGGGRRGLTGPGRVETAPLPRPGVGPEVSQGPWLPNVLEEQAQKDPSSGPE